MTPVARTRSVRGDLLALTAILALAGCRGEPPGTALTAERVRDMVDSLMPVVEQASGLEFRATPRSELASVEYVTAYLQSRVARDFPPQRLEGIQAAYRLFGLLPDTLDLERLLVGLYSEQVAGYYDPETETLYAVEGRAPAQIRLVMAHELVHALQHQYLPLDSLMAFRDNGDRLAAVHAVLEGHATVASVRTLTPGRDPTGEPEFWETYHEQVRIQQRQMPVFATAPLVLREALIFPYLSGAVFMQWWGATRGTPLPEVGQMPASTEQILHPDRFTANDQPVPVGFETDREVLFEDTLGELEIQILDAVLRGADQAALDRPLGWAGDRYRVFRNGAGSGYVLEWRSVWDSEAAADRFAAMLRERYLPLAKPGETIRVERLEIEGRPGLEVLRAKGGWPG